MQSTTVVNRRFRDFSRARFVFEDNIFNTTNQTFTETGVSLVPEAGINVIFFRANGSPGSEGVAGTSLQATYAGGEIGVSLANTNVQVGHWNSIELHGWKVIDCDGTSEVKLLARVNGSSRSVDVGAQQLISLPLEGWKFVEDTHYFLQQSEATTVFSEPFETLVTIDTFNFTVPTTGKYLTLWYAEGAQAEFAALGEFVIYGFTDDPDPGESNRSQHQAREGLGGVGDLFHSWAWSEVRNFNAGSNSISVRARRWNGFTDVSIKRPRMLVISMDAFKGTTSQTVSFTDTITTSNSFVENTVMARTHNSAARKEQVLVIVNQTDDPKPGGSNNHVATYKIRDNTLGIDYATDSGERYVDFFSNVQSHMFFALKENVSGNTDWKVFIRNANNTGANVKVTYGSIAVMGLTPDV